MDIDGITSAVTVLVKDVQAIVKGSSKKTPYGMFRDNVKAFSMLTGIPAYGALREAQTWWNALVGNQVEELKLTTKKLTKADERRADYKEYLKAVEDGEGVEERIERLMEQGYHKKEILSELQKEYKKAYQEADKEEREALEEKLYPALSALGEDPEEILESWAETSLSYDSLDTALKEGQGIREAVSELLEMCIRDRS